MEFGFKQKPLQIPINYKTQVYYQQLFNYFLSLLVLFNKQRESNKNNELIYGNKNGNKNNGNTQPVLTETYR